MLNLYSYTLEKAFITAPHTGARLHRVPNKFRNKS
jgi:hypothetical protein